MPINSNEKDLNNFYISLLTKYKNNKKALILFKNTYTYGIKTKMSFKEIKKRLLKNVEFIKIASKKLFTIPENNEQSNNNINQVKSNNHLLKPKILKNISINTKTLHKTSKGISVSNYIKSFFILPINNKTASRHRQSRQLRTRTSKSKSMPKNTKNLFNKLNQLEQNRNRQRTSKSKSMPKNTQNLFNKLKQLEKMKH
jgi:hypothetical protein